MSLIDDFLIAKVYFCNLNDDFIKSQCFIKFLDDYFP